MNWNSCTEYNAFPIAIISTGHLMAIVYRLEYRIIQDFALSLKSRIFDEEVHMRYRATIQNCAIQTCLFIVLSFGFFFFFFFNCTSFLPLIHFHSNCEIKRKDSFYFPPSIAISKNIFDTNHEDRIIHSNWNSAWILNRTLCTLKDVYLCESATINIPSN